MMAGKWVSLRHIDTNCSSRYILNTTCTVGPFPSHGIFPEQPLFRVEPC